MILVKEVPVRATVTLDENLLRTAQEYTGIQERSALMRTALEALIHQEASHRLAALGGSEPDMVEIKRLRVDQL